LLHYVPQFFQIIIAALFVPLFLAIKKQSKSWDKKVRLYKIENMAIIYKIKTATMPGVLPVMVRK
jgi:hypothetical protein